MVGGGGVFGSRLMAGLLGTTNLDVTVAGRRADTLDAAIAQISANAAPGTAARLSAFVMDGATIDPGALAATGAFVVVDAAGPFQGGTHRLARTAIAAGLHYVDLADARDHVAEFAALDGAAKAAGVVALTGASSTPALSNAALDALTAGWSQVDRVDIALSPGNRAPRGLSVVRAILSYAGRPVRVFSGGVWQSQPGWGMTVRRTLPGLGRRWLSLAETPDLDIVPQRFRVTETVVFRAGLELPILHLGLWTASLPVRAGLLRSLAPLARPMRALAALLERFGTDRGGMVLEATGRDGQGRAIRATWSLIAEAGDGPTVPTLPALAILRALASGHLHQAGASACVGVLPLAAIEAEFSGHRITSRQNRTLAPDSLYRRVLGSGFDVLPGPVQRLHTPGWGLRARGIAAIDGPAGGVARLVALLFRFPPAGESVPLEVALTPSSGRERWVRRFGRMQFASVLSASRMPGGIVERFGPFSFELALEVAAAGVVGMPVRGWRVGPIPLPLAFAPLSVVSETVDDRGRFRFDVELRLPLNLGRLVRYRGWLTGVSD